MGGRYARELRRVWRGYLRKDRDATEKEFKAFLEKTKAELGDKYITYQDVGLALHELAPIDKEDQDERIKFFWKIADQWNPEIRMCLRRWQETMQR